MYICTYIYNVHIFTIVKVLLSLSKCVLKYTVMFRSYIFLSTLQITQKIEHYCRVILWQCMVDAKHVCGCVIQPLNMEANIST